MDHSQPNLHNFHWSHLVANRWSDHPAVHIGSALHENPDTQPPRRADTIASFAAEPLPNGAIRLANLCSSFED